MHAFVYSFIDWFTYYWFMYVFIYLVGWFNFQLIIETLQSTEIYSHINMLKQFISLTRIDCFKQNHLIPSI